MNMGLTNRAMEASRTCWTGREGSRQMEGRGAGGVRWRTLPLLMTISPVYMAEKKEALLWATAPIARFKKKHTQTHIHRVTISVTPTPIFEASPEAFEHLIQSPRSFILRPLSAKPPRLVTDALDGSHPSRWGTGRRAKTAREWEKVSWWRRQFDIRIRQCQKGGRAWQSVRHRGMRCIQRVLTGGAGER